MKSIRLFWGVIIVGWFSYRYLILSRTPYPINENISLMMLTCVTLICLVYIIQIWVVIKQLRVSSLTLPGANLGKLLLDFFYNKPLESVRNFCMSFSFIQNRILEWAFILEYTVTTKLLAYLIVFLMLIVPQSLLAVALLIDILILNKIVVFFQTLWVILFSLCFRIILNMLHAQCTDPTAKIYDIVHALQLAQNTRFYLYCKLKLNFIFSTLWLTYIYKVLICYAAIFLQNNPLFYNYIYIWLIKYLLNL